MSNGFKGRVILYELKILIGNYEIVSYQEVILSEVPPINKNTLIVKQKMNFERLSAGDFCEFLWCSFECCPHCSPRYGLVSAGTFLKGDGFGVLKMMNKPIAGHNFLNKLEPKLLLVFCFLFLTHFAMINQFYVEKK